MGAATGFVVSIVAGYYFVELEGTIYLCRGRGKLRNAGDSPLAGDYVRFSRAEGEETGTVEEILPRRNQLLRPAVANVDAVILVVSALNPAPDLLGLDKLLVLALSRGIEPVVCVNKADLDPPGAETYVGIYDKAGFKTVVCSATTGLGIEELTNLIADRVVVLAGQSGVGKSRIASRISVQTDMPVRIGEISAKLGRGKHTTRQVSLLPLAGGGKVADTPGFSVVGVDLESRSLHRFFPEFQDYADDCQFSPCLHIHEPACAVKDGLARGEICSQRYENYLKIFQELKEREAKRY